jgi:hypothetical protein
MDKVLSGIAGGSRSPRYDTLGNLAKICGKGTAFMDGLAMAIKNIRTAVQLMGDIDRADDVED